MQLLFKRGAKQEDAAPSASAKVPALPSTATIMATELTVLPANGNTQNECLTKSFGLARKAESSD